MNTKKKNKINVLDSCRQWSFSILGCLLGLVATNERVATGQLIVDYQVSDESSFLLRVKHGEVTHEESEVTNIFDNWDVMINFSSPSSGSYPYSWADNLVIKEQASHLSAPHENEVASTNPYIRVIEYYIYDNIESHFAYSESPKVTNIPPKVTIELHSGDAGHIDIFYSTTTFVAKKEPDLPVQAIQITGFTHTLMGLHLAKDFDSFMRYLESGHAAIGLATLTSNPEEPPAEGDPSGGTYLIFDTTDNSLSGQIFAWDITLASGGVFRIVKRVEGQDDQILWEFEVPPSEPGKPVRFPRIDGEPIPEPAINDLLDGQDILIELLNNNDEIVLSGPIQLMNPPDHRIQINGEYRECLESANTKSYDITNAMHEPIYDFIISIEKEGGGDPGAVIKKVRCVSVANPYDIFYLDEDMDGERGTWDDNYTDDWSPGTTTRIYANKVVVYRGQSQEIFYDKMEPESQGRWDMDIELDKVTDGNWCITIQPTDKDGAAIGKALSDSGLGEGQATFGWVIPEEAAEINTYNNWLSINGLNETGEDLHSIQLTPSGNYTIVDASPKDENWDRLQDILHFDPTTGILTFPEPIPAGQPWAVAVEVDELVVGEEMILNASPVTPTDHVIQINGAYRECFRSAKAKPYDITNAMQEPIYDFIISIEKEGGGDPGALIYKVLCESEPPEIGAFPRFTVDDNMDGKADTLGSESGYVDESPGTITRIFTHITPMEPGSKKRWDLDIQLDKVTDGNWCIIIQPTDKDGAAIGEALSDSGLGEGHASFGWVIPEEAAEINTFNNWLSINGLNETGEDLHSIQLAPSGNYTIVDARPKNENWDRLQDVLYFDPTTGILTFPEPVPAGQPWAVAVEVDELVSGEEMTLDASLPGTSQALFSSDIGMTGGFDHYDPDTGIYKIIAGGADIWGTADQCHYLYFQASGDFDAKVYVLGIFAGNIWTKLGLMARQDLTTTAVNVLACATLGGGNGRALQWRSEPGGQSNSIPGSEPATRQPQWIRLKRVGNTFTAYSSSDGVSWDKIGEININMTDPVYIGIAATSHDVDYPLFALFTDLEIEGDITTPEFPEDMGLSLTWWDIPGTVVNYLLNNDRFPNSPDVIMSIPFLDAHQDQGDYYAQWVKGIYIPITSGDYNFYIASDDNSELFISSDTDTKGPIELIAKNPGWGGYQEFNKYPEQQSGPITLEAGQPYRIDALMKEGGGGDHLTVAYTGPDNESPTPLPITLGDSLPFVINFYPDGDVTPSKNNLTVEQEQVFLNTIASFEATTPFKGLVRWATPDLSDFGPSVNVQDDIPPSDWRTVLEDQPFTAGHNEFEIVLEPGPQTIEIESDDGRSFKVHIDVKNEVPVINLRDIAEATQTTDGITVNFSGEFQYILNGTDSASADIDLPEINLIPPKANLRIEAEGNPVNTGGVRPLPCCALTINENPGGIFFEGSRQFVGAKFDVSEGTKNVQVTGEFDDISGGNQYSKAGIFATPVDQPEGPHVGVMFNRDNTFFQTKSLSSNDPIEESNWQSEEVFEKRKVTIDFNLENGTFNAEAHDTADDFLLYNLSGDIPFDTSGGLTAHFAISGNGSAASVTVSNPRIVADGQVIFENTNQVNLNPEFQGWNNPAVGTIDALNENDDVIGSSEPFNTAGDNTTIDVLFDEGAMAEGLDSITFTVEKLEADTTTQGTIKINNISLVWDPQVKASQKADPPEQDAVPGFLIRTIQAVNDAGWGYTGMKRLLKYGFVGTTAPKPKDFPVPIRAQVEGTRISPFVNLSDSGGLGYFSTDNGYPDETYPGVDSFESPAGDPGSGDDDDNFATEALALIHLTAGKHTIGANSDDGTIIRVGGVKIGQTDEFKGTSNVDFNFEVDEDGWYDFWAQSLEGAGGAALELHEVQTDGTRILLGDVDQGGSTVMVPAAWIPPEPPKPVEWADDFEDGNLNIGIITWNTSGDASWTTSSNQAQSGVKSAESGDIGNDEETIMETTLDCGNGEVSFYRRVSSEYNYDYLIFEIDGEEKDRWSGEEDWEKVSYQVTAGRHTFTFKYVKDSSSDGGSDRAWIDDFTAPVAAAI